MSLSRPLALKINFKICHLQWKNKKSAHFYTSLFCLRVSDGHGLENSMNILNLQFLSLAFLQFVSCILTPLLS